MLGEPLAVVGEDGRDEDVLVRRHVEEPAEEEVGLEAAAELALGADRVERLEEQRLQQPLGRDRRPAVPRIRGPEVAVHAAERLVDHALDGAERMVPLDEFLEIDGVPEAAVGFAVSAHGGRFVRRGSVDF